jgi:two-component system, NtrC family, sensor kinase
MMAPSPLSFSPPTGLVESLTRVADRVGLGIIVSTKDTADLRGNIVYANAAAGQLLGVSCADLPGQSVESLRFGNAVFVVDDATALRVPSSSREIRGEILREDGQRIAAQWLLVVSNAAERPLIVHLLSRVERVVRVEQALHDSEQRFRRLIDIAPDGILVLVGTRIVYANQAITKMHGYVNARQLCQLNLRHLFHEDDRELLECCLLGLREGTATAHPIQLRAVRRDGRTVPVEVALLRTEWDEGPSVLATVRDLAGRRIVQSQLVHTDRLAAVGTLAAGVAHEINNPLAYVLLNLQYLIRELPKVSANSDRVGQLVERLREARHGAERVVSIVKDLRTFSKVDEERLGPVDLRRVLMSALKVARSQLMNRGQIIEIFEEVRPAYGHSARLEQVFLNLLINAIQALPGARTESNRIVLRLHEERRGPHDYVIVEVADTGAGIPPENLDRVFDPFFTTKPVGLGTGLGLPICHSIVTRMGGGIRVESTVGVGTTFFVGLPVAYAERNATPYNPSPLPAGLARRARILVVDDEVAVATMLSRVLGEEHDVETASSAEQALQLMEEVSFDVVFCDLLMPHMTGMDLFAEVSRRFPGRQNQIAFMTGGAFTPRAARFLSGVTNPRIEKPFDLRTVRGILRDLLLKSGNTN